MSKIKITNFGPIKSGYQENDGFLEIKKTTLFIGNQGSGKSTVAKTISVFSWLEKSINRGDTQNITFSKFINFFNYQKIHNYFKKNTYLEYFGEKYYIKYDTSEKHPIIREIEDSQYVVPKIMYVPAERNFLSTISDAYNMKGLPDNIFTFAEELKKAQKATNGEKVELQIGTYKYKYKESEDISFVVGDDYQVNLLEASSGLQSYIPLYLVSHHLCMSITKDEAILKKNMSVTQSIRMENEIKTLMLNKTISDNNTTKEIDKIQSRYYNKCFFNIVEEPEQNLFPTSQWEMLKTILFFNGLNKENKLLITTHSPYIINYLAIAVKAYQIKINTKISTGSIHDLAKLIPPTSTINPNNLAIYEFNENDGTIQKLSNYNGLPSDENLLNSGLGQINDLFINLLEIEDKCQ